MSMITRNHAVLDLNKKTGQQSGLYYLGTSSYYVAFGGKLLSFEPPESLHTLCLLTLCDAQFLNGGDERIRTSAQVAPPKALAKPPLRPLGYISILCAL